VANSFAQSILAWKDFLRDVENLSNGAVRVGKEVAQAGKEAFSQKSIAPISNYVKNILEKNKKLEQSYNSLSKDIKYYEERLKGATSKKHIEAYAYKLDQLNKAAAKHPGNPARIEKAGGGGGGKDGKGGGGFLSSAIGLFKKDGLLGKGSNVASFLKSGVKLQEDLVKIPVKDRTDADKANLKRSGLSATATETDTVGKKFEKFNEKLQMGIGDVALSFMPLLDRLLSFGNTLIDTLLPQIMQFAQPIMDILNSLPLEDILGTIMKVVGAILAAVGPVIEELKPLFDALFEAFNPLLQSIGGLIIALAEGLGPVLGLIVHIAAAVLGPIIKGLAKAFGWLVDIVKEIVEWVSPILEFIARSIALIVDGVLGMFGFQNKKTGTIGYYRDEKKGEKSSVTVTDAVRQKNSGLLKAAPDTSKNTEVKTQANKTAGDITSGGPRVININGVKFTDKIEMHVLSAKEGIRDLEAHMQEMFLRILNSGAAYK
jgi:hypothetical protein